MAKKAYPRKPSTRKRDYDTVASDPGTSAKLETLAKWVSEKNSGLFCSRARALTIAVDEALAKRGLK